MELTPAMLVDQNSTFIFYNIAGVSTRIKWNDLCHLLRLK
jgi:hypothetical protein